MSGMYQSALRNVEERESHHKTIFDKFRGSSYAKFMTIAGIPLAAMGSAIGMTATAGVAVAAAPLLGAVLAVTATSLAAAAVLGVGDKIGKGLFSFAKGLGNKGLDAALSSSSQAWKNIQATQSNLNQVGIEQTNTNTQYLSNLMRNQGTASQAIIDRASKDVQKDLLNGLKADDFMGPDVVQMHKAFHAGVAYAAGTNPVDEKTFYANSAHGMNEYFKHEGMKNEGLATRVMGKLSSRFLDTYAEKKTTQALETFDAAQKIQAHVGLTAKTDFFAKLKQAGYESIRPDATSSKTRQEPSLG